MTKTDLQLGGGYIYQWECAVLLALNYFFEPVRYNPTLFDLVEGFLGQVAEIHLEGKDKESGVELEDIALVSGERRILIQVKTKQAEGERWTPSDTLLCKALYKFYASPFLDEQRDDTRFVFLTNRPFNPDLVRIKDAIIEGTLEQCVEADKLYKSLDRCAHKEKKGESIDAGRFREMLTRTALVEYLAVDTVKANVQAKLQAYGRSDWEQAYNSLYEHFSRQSTREGGATITHESVIEVLGPPPATRSETDALNDYLARAVVPYQAPLIEAWPEVAGEVARPIDPLLNPFYDRGRINDPARLFDRRRILRELRQALAVGNSVSLVGEREIGKSSVLYALYKTADEWLPKKRVHYLDLQAVINEEDFCAEVLEGMGREPGGLRALKRALRYEPLVLLLDEVEKLNRPEFTQNLHDLLRALAQEPTLTLAVSSHSRLVEVFTPESSGSPFHNIFTEKQLGPFAANDARQFLRERLRGTGVIFDSAEIERLVVESGGHPAKLQRMACRLFDQKRGG